VALALQLDGYEAVERKVALASDSSLELVLKEVPRKPVVGPKKPKSEVTPDGIIDPFAQ
jgi:hypothetical protein